MNYFLLIITNLNMSEIKFQSLIDVIGDSWILLDFMSFLNPEQQEQYNGIYISNAMCVKDKETKIERKNNILLVNNLPYTGIYYNSFGFNEGHWVAYENGNKKWDSSGGNISHRIQIPGSANYCQSFAAFLFCSKGLYNKKHNIKLKKLKYNYDIESASFNIISLSKLWLKYFNGKNKTNEWKNWLRNSIKQTNSNLDKIISTLKEIISKPELNKKLAFGNF